jgi:hypothetical protein
MQPEATKASMPPSEVNDSVSHLRVTCKTGLRGTKPYNHLLGIGGTDAAQHWHRTEAEAMLLMLEGKEKYYVSTPSGDEDIVSATYDGFPHTYLKAASDGVEPLRLAALPECPESPYHIKR